ncbi:MAG TPA: hypothetical protein DIU15_09600, partial [Deltaproteobacteria bacterium]|nr:hypothetical protein [Deltaproteobacteria bacterium]
MRINQLQLRPLLVALAVMPLTGCFWGEADSQVFFKVGGENFEYYEDLLYPTDRKDEWTEMFEARDTLCDDGSDDCGVEDLERSDLLDLYVPFETTRVRGLLTQKRDLQVTAHLDVGQAFKALADDDYDDWAYLRDVERAYGREGQGCSADLEAAERTGVGRCLLSEVESNPGPYARLGEDLRLVILINLPGEDDIRSTRCQDRSPSFESDDWEYPRTLRVNYAATEPVEIDDGLEVYGGEEDPPLALCDIEVYARLQLGSEVFSANYYGKDDEDQEFTLERINGEDDTMLGTVELEELILPDEEGDSRVRG